MPPIQFKLTICFLYVCSIPSRAIRNVLPSRDRSVTATLFPRVYTSTAQMNAHVYLHNLYCDRTNTILLLWPDNVPLCSVFLLPPAQRIFKAGVFNLLRERANLHLSYNLAGRSHCRLQNHHGYIKHHHRGISDSPGDVGEVPMT